MKPGDLVLYNTQVRYTSSDQPKKWMGTILEIHSEGWVKIFWHDLKEIQIFEIGSRDKWEVISEGG